MDLSKYEIEIKHHVFIQALKRGIDPDIIEDVIKKGKVKLFGKNYVKFINTGTKRTIICVGEIVVNKIKIITIEEGN